MIALLGSDDEQVVQRARRALTGAWEFTLPHMLEALHNHPESQVRQWLAITLRSGRLSTHFRSPVIEAAPEVPALLRALKDPDPNVRLAAAGTITVVAPGVALWSDAMHAMVPELLDAAQNPQLPPQIDPFEPLTLLAESDQLVIPPVTDIAPAQRSSAVRFLTEHAPSSIAVLREALRSEDEGRRRWASDLVSRIGAPAADLAPELIRIAKEGSPDEQLSAASALASVGAAPDVALEAIRRALENRRIHFVETRALEALVQLVGSHPPAVSDLAPLLAPAGIGSESRWLARPEHLIKIGERAPNVPELTTALQRIALENNWRQACEAAFVALQQIDPAAATEIASDYYQRLANDRQLFR